MKRSKALNLTPIRSADGATELTLRLIVRVAVKAGTRGPGEIAKLFRYVVGPRSRQQRYIHSAALRHSIRYWFRTGERFSRSRAVYSSLLSEAGLPVRPNAGLEWACGEWYGMRGVGPCRPPSTFT